MMAPLVRTGEDAAGPASPSAGDKAGADLEFMGADDATAVARREWRRWRVPLAMIGVILLGGVAVGAISRLSPPPKPNTYLDPASDNADGAQALTDLLGERGYTVVHAYSASSALAALRPGEAGRGTAASGSTLVITSPYLLTHRQLVRLGKARADLFVVEAGTSSLQVLAPPVRVANPQAWRSGHLLTGRFGRLLQPGCTLPAARLAGTVNLGGSTYRAPASATACYRFVGFPSLIRYRSSGRWTTILGSGVPLTNGWLASNGNAALALNLLSVHRRIVWLTPEPPPASGSPPGQAHPAGPTEPAGSAPALIPWQAWLVVIQLGAAVVLVAFWRARRLGPLIAERLPVVVRASETVEGHAALYQSRRARGRAASALRNDLLARMLPVLGLARDAPAEAVTSAVASRSRHDQQAIAGILYGEEPGNDAELVALARSLDELEREVCAQ
ncbi:MAG: hypothetical protein LBV34_05815 [Nocardiopsaceae bacterium]|jgi:hypothetical protein|nr:hypothetical protein [Nocardiopsaceae bacterium]